MVWLKRNQHWTPDDIVVFAKKAEENGFKEFERKYLILDNSKQIKLDNLVSKIGSDNHFSTSSPDKKNSFTYDNTCRVYYKKLGNDTILLDFEFRGDLVI